MPVKIYAKAGFEFVVQLDDYDDLVWWSGNDHGEVVYECDYEYKELKIYISIDDIV